MPSRRITHQLVLLLALLFSGIPAAFSQPHHAAPVREADAVCGACHREILDSYLKTSMANASGLATERLRPGTYLNPASATTYSITNDAGKAQLHLAIASTPPVSATENLEYYLGSGHLGLTYLYEKNGYWLESPIAWYAKLSAYTMAPGLETLRDTPALPLNPTCLRCHMSAVQKQVAGTENLYQAAPFQQVGITCEGCHGDTREHVSSHGKAAVVNPIKLSPAKRDSTCIVCHLEGDTHVEHRGKDPLDFKPGEDILDYISYFVLNGTDTTRRAVSEIEQFNSSKCKRVSGPSMSCMNCHDPHSSPSPEQRVAFYRAKCLACHTTPAIAREHFPATPDCTGCHMPKTGSENIAHVAWTDHRILRRSDPAGLSLAALPQTGNAATDLVPLFRPSQGARELGLAYYDLAVKGDTSAAPKALQYLTTAASVDHADATVLRSLGILAQRNHDTAQAQVDYRAALKADGANFVAGTNLGTLLAVSGDLEGAAALWVQLFKNNQDIPQLGQNLAIVECRLGDRDQALQVLRTVLIYSPGLTNARNLLTSIENGQQRCAPPLAANPLAANPLPH